MGNYTIFLMFENPRRGRQARNITTNVPKILDLKSSSEEIFFRKLSLGAPELCGKFMHVCRIWVDDLAKYQVWYIKITKIQYNKFVIMLKRNSIKFHSTPHWRLALYKWEPAGRMGDFGKLNGFAKSPRLIVLNIDWAQFVLKNCEIPHSVRALYDK